MIVKMKLIRENRGITQKELSQRTGIGIKTIHAYEQGAILAENIGLGKAVKIAKALGCTAEDLL